MDEKNKFVALRAQGKSLRECSEILDVSKSTLCLWTKDLKSLILTARGIEQEEFFRTLKVAKEERLRAFAVLLERIRFELENRSLKSLTEEKLIDLLIKIDVKVSELYQEPTAAFVEEDTDFVGNACKKIVVRSIA